MTHYSATRLYLLAYSFDFLWIYCDEQLSIRALRIDYMLDQPPIVFVTLAHRLLIVAVHPAFLSISLFFRYYMYLLYVTSDRENYIHNNAD